MLNLIDIYLYLCSARVIQMVMNIIFLIAGVSVIALGLYMNRRVPGVSQKDIVIPEDHIAPRKAVRSLPVIDESDRGTTPSEGAGLSAVESACIANEPDISDISFEEPAIKQELEELGYRFTRTIPPTNTTNQQTVIDAFDDGRCYFPAPETPGLGDDLTPADNQ